MDTPGPTVSGREQPDSAKKKSSGIWRDWGFLPATKREHNPDAAAALGRLADRSEKHLEQRKTEELLEKLETSKQKIEELEEEKQKLREEEEFLKKDTEECHSDNTELAEQIQQKESELQKMLAFGKLKSIYSEIDHICDAWADEEQKAALNRTINRTDLSISEWLSQSVSAPRVCPFIRNPMQFMSLGAFLVTYSPVDSEIFQILFSVLEQDVLSSDEIVQFLSLPGIDRHTVGECTIAGILADTKLTNKQLTVRFIKLLQTRLTSEQAFQVLSVRDADGSTPGMVLASECNLEISIPFLDLLRSLPPKLFSDLLKQRMAFGNGEEKTMGYMFLEWELNFRVHDYKAKNTQRMLYFLDIVGDKLSSEQLSTFLSKFYLLPVWAYSEAVSLKIVDLLKKLDQKQAVEILGTKLGSIPPLEEVLRQNGNAVRTALDEIHKG